jgi:hypothetical protein
MSAADASGTGFAPPGRKPANPEIAMSKHKDNLPAVVAVLERILEGPAVGAASSPILDQALARLEEVVRHHASMLYQPGALIDDAERPRLPSPGVDRKIAHLGEELELLLRDIQDLKARTPVPGQRQASADYAGLLRRARQLALALEQFNDKEAHVILDSVNTDLGAGD